MRTLHILQQRPEKTGSGVYFQNLAMACAKMGEEVGVLYGADDDLRRFPDFFERRFRFRGECPIAVPGMSDSMPYPAARYDRMTPEEHAAYLAYVEEVLRRTIEAFRPERIYAHHLFYMTDIAVRLAHEKGIPVIAISHGTDIRRLRNHPALIDEMPHLKDTDAVCALTLDNAKDIEEIYGVPGARIRVTYGGYQPSIFFPDRRRLAENTGVLSVMAAGKIHRAKGIFELARAMATRTEVVFDIIGDGAPEERGELRHMVDRMPHASLYNTRDQKGLAEVMRDHDLFAFPSYYEGLGLMAIEAIACGLTLVVNALPSVMAFLPRPIAESPFCLPVEMPALEGQDAIAPGARAAYIERLGSAIDRAAAMRRSADLVSAYEAIAPYLAQCTWEALAAKVRSSLA